MSAGVPVGVPAGVTAFSVHNEYFPQSVAYARIEEFVYSIRRLRGSTSVQVEDSLRFHV
jgi:hypothetical protein